MIGLLSFVVSFRVLMKLNQLPYYSPLGSKFRSPDEYWLPFHMGVPTLPGSSSKCLTRSEGVNG